MSILKKKVSCSLSDLLELNASSYDKEFSIKAFQRKYRKVFKFSTIRDNYFVFTSKITGLSYAVDIEPNNYFIVKRSFNPNLYSLCCLNQKEFIEKLIKHNLY